MPHEPWKQDCQACEAPDPELLADPRDFLLPGEGEALARLMAPLQTWIQLLEQGEPLVNVPVEQEKPIPRLGLGENLVVLVGQVVEGLLRHEQAACIDQG